MLLTDAYLAQQRALHATGDYGQASVVYGSMVSQLCAKAEAQTLLDYGCGSKQSLREVLACDAEYRGYDPAVDAFSSEPAPADVVACIDVLEHVEPQCLDSVLDHIGSLTKRLLFVSIHCGPAKKTLPDGRNAHLIQERAVFWLPRLLGRWDLRQFAVTKHGFWAVMHVY